MNECLTQTGNWQKTIKNQSTFSIAHNDCIGIMYHSINDLKVAASLKSQYQPSWQFKKTVPLKVLTLPVGGLALWRIPVLNNA